MGIINQIFQKGEDEADFIICPKCPSTPIISIHPNNDGKLICEYRCQFMHYGQIDFNEINKDNKNKHGLNCDKCKTKIKKEENNINEEEELLYCGVCKIFICNKCKSMHDEEKESHKILVPKSKIGFTCLQHGKRYIGYCFSCLFSICPECIIHKKHCFKKFEEFYSEPDFLDKYNNYKKKYKEHIDLLKFAYNNEFLKIYIKRCNMLFNFTDYLYNNFKKKRERNILNGETIINLLNVVTFDFRISGLYKESHYINYYKRHMILSNQPISETCTFSKTKSDYKINKIKFEPYYIPNFIILQENKPVFKYSSFSDFIIFYSEKSIYFLSTTNNKNIFEIRHEKTINSFNIINKNILCVCCDKIYFYELLKYSPYYKEFTIFPQLDLSNEQIFQVIGNLDKKLIIRTKVGLFSITVDTKKNEFKIIHQLKTPYRITDLKGIYDNYLIMLEERTYKNISIIDLNKFEIINKKKFEIFFIDCLVYNGNILIPEYNCIYFYSIPNLEKISCLELSNDIFYMNITNNKTFIVTEKNCIEQFETKTWRIISKYNDNNKIMNNIFIIGAGKKLFLFDDKLNIIYNAIK